MANTAGLETSQTGAPDPQAAADSEHADGPNLALTIGQTGLYPQIVLFGDSITQRATLTCQARLQNWYTRQADVVNRGFSGYTASLAISILPYFLPLKTPDPSPVQPTIRLVTIFFGANDAAIPGNAQHVPIDTYVTDLRRIAEYPVFRRHGTRLIFITPGPVDEWQLGKPLTRTVTNARDYALAMRKLAKEMQIPCVDIWTAFTKLARDAVQTPDTRGDTQDPLDMSDSQHTDIEQAPFDALPPGSLSLPPNPVLDTLLDDGLHFAPAGYDVLYDELTAVIEREVPECMPENLPWVFRAWKEVLGDAPVQQPAAVVVAEPQGLESDSASTLPVETVQVVREAENELKPKVGTEAMVTVMYENDDAT